MVKKIIRSIFNKFNYDITKLGNGSEKYKIESASYQILFYKSTVLLLQ